MRPVIAIGILFGIGFQYSCVVFHVGPYIFILLSALGAGVIKGFFKQCSLGAGFSHLGGKKGLVSGVILFGDGVGVSLMSIYYN